MKDHFCEKHQNGVLETNEQLHAQVTVDPLVLSNYGIITPEAIFYLQIREESKSVHAFVKLVGPDADTSKYRAVIRVCSKREEGEFVAVGFATLGCKEDSEEIVRTGKGMKLPYNIISKLMDGERKLLVKIEIVGRNVTE